MPSPGSSAFGRRPSILAGQSSPYLGHEVELDLLQRRLTAASTGRGGLVVLRGEIGMGTTRTAHQVAARADRLGMVVLWGQFIEGLLSRPFGGLADALEELATGLPANELRDQLGAGAPALARMCPRLRQVLPDIPPSAPLDALDERLRLHDAVLGWLRRAARARPLLIVLDDLHLAEADVRAMLDHVAPAAAGLPVLFLGTWATPPASGDDAHGAGGLAGELVDIDGLDEGATGAMLAEMVERPLPSETLNLIQQASGGHPLFARELYRHLAEEGRLRGAAAAQMPATFEDVIAWRVSRLPLEGRTALGALACFPLGAPPQLLAEASGLSRARLVEALERSVEGGVVRAHERGGHYVVAHDRIRRALVAATPVAVRARVHALAAELLEAELGADARTHAGELAWHLTHAVRGADSDRRALRYLLVAAEQASAAYAHLRAVECLERAVELAAGPAGGGRAGAERAGGLSGVDRADLISRLAVAQAEIGLEDAAGATLYRLLGERRRAQPLDFEVWRAIVAALRHMRPADPAGSPRPPTDAYTRVHDLALEQPPTHQLLRPRLELLGEGWAERGWSGEGAAVRALVWRVDEGGAADQLREESTDEADLVDAYAAPRPRDAGQTAALAGQVRNWRRPPLVLRGMHALTSDLVLRLGLFREGAAHAARYLAAAERGGSLHDVAAALFLLARCRAVLGELEVSKEIIAAADGVVARIPAPAGLATERLLTALVIAHYTDGDWAGLALSTSAAAASPAPAGLLLGAEVAVAYARSGGEVEARALIPVLLDAAGDLPPLTYARDAALLVTLTAAWEVGAAEHVPTGRLLVERAGTAGAGACHAATPRLCLARLDGLLGNVRDAREQMAAERERLDAAGMRPLRAIVDHDEAIVVAAAGPAGHTEATNLFDRAVDQFAALGMRGWIDRVRSLRAAGFEAAAQPGGRLHFSYPAGLSRREADLLRLIDGGATPAEAGQVLDLDTPSVERHLASAMDKLGAASVEELPRLARRYGLGGG